MNNAKNNANPVDSTNVNFNISSKKSLFVVAHQDDEVFIVSRIRKHLTEGDQVFVLWTAASYQKGEGFKETRLRESKILMEKLKIPESQLYFLMYPDGSTHQHIGDIVADLTVKIREIDPDLIYIPAYEGGHIDHDTAHYCTVEAVHQLSSLAEIYEFPEYSGYATPLGLLPLRMRQYPETLGTECRTLSDEEYHFVLDCWKIFKSQHFPLNLLIKLSTGKRLTFGIEYTRRLPRYDYQELPPTEKIAYERYLDSSYEDFKLGIQNYLNQTRGSKTTQQASFFEK